jgi:hypothetical protein
VPVERFSYFNSLERGNNSLGMMEQGTAKDESLMCA